MVLGEKAAGEARPRKGSTGLTALAVGSLGVVFGDIGTSPLYTFGECIGGPHGAAPTPENVWGILSLIFWSLMVVVTLKYVAVLLNADNHGEGGMMALLALVPSKRRQIVAGRIGFVSLMVIAGAALLFGDGVITPAISVLSAIEGLDTINPHLQQYVVPVTVLILLGLFSAQSKGTGRLGALFGPVMVVWFTTIGLLGLRSILSRPEVLWGLLPSYGLRFLLSDGSAHHFALLGSVVLAVTGGEALYADLGHFGKRPIRMSWLGLVLPSLVLCYFGQGALILSDPYGVSEPFFALVSSTQARIALVLLAALATIIASQGLISAVFSLCHQAIRLGFMPRMRVLHTSRDVIGQIYVPFVNWSLAFGCITLVLIFQKSSALAAAFGLAVSGAMTLTSVIFYHAARHSWGWSAAGAGALVGFFLLFDLPFFGATLLKFHLGGYIPFIIGSLLFLMMTIWCRGRSFLNDYDKRTLEPVSRLPEMVAEYQAKTVPGLGICLTAHTDRLPRVLTNQVVRLHSVFEIVVLVSVTTASAPFVVEEARMRVERDSAGDVYRVDLDYGFMEVPDIPRAVAVFRASAGIPESTAQTFLLGRVHFMAEGGGAMPAWEESIFSFLSRNCLDTTANLKLPLDQVIEVYSRLDL